MRFTFLNEQLVAKGERSLVDSNYYEDATLINTLLEDRYINELVNDPVFMDLWNKYELNTADGRVAKWESYVAKSL